MLWLLAAEFRKLVRPLMWGTALAIVTFCLLITWGAAHNAASGLASPKLPDICSTAQTNQCKQVIARADYRAHADAAATYQLTRPGEVGHVAAGMLASLPGLLLIAMVAGGHWAANGDQRPSGSCCAGRAAAGGYCWPSSSRSGRPAPPPCSPAT